MTTVTPPYDRPGQVSGPDIPQPATSVAKNTRPAPPSPLLMRTASPALVAGYRNPVAGSPAQLSEFLGRELVLLAGEDPRNFTPAELQQVTEYNLGLQLQKRYDVYQKYTQDQPPLTEAQWREAKRRTHGQFMKALKQVKDKYPGLKHVDENVSLLQQQATKQNRVMGDPQNVENALNNHPRRTPPGGEQAANGLSDFLNDTPAGKLWRDYTLLGNLVKFFAGHDGRVAFTASEKSVFTGHFSQWKDKEVVPVLKRGLNALFEKGANRLSFEDREILQKGRLEVVTPVFEYKYMPTRPTPLSPGDTGPSRPAEGVDDSLVRKGITEPVAGQHVLVIKAEHQGKTRFFTFSTLSEDRHEPVRVFNDLGKNSGVKTVLAGAFQHYPELQSALQQSEYKNEAPRADLTRITFRHGGPVFPAKPGQDNIRAIADFMAEKEVDRLTAPLLQAQLTPTTAESLVKGLLEFTAGFIPFVDCAGNLRDGNYQDAALPCVVDGLPVVGGLVAKGGAKILRVARRWRTPRPDLPPVNPRKTVITQPEKMTAPAPAKLPEHSPSEVPPLARTESKPSDRAWKLGPADPDNGYQRVVGTMHPEGYPLYARKDPGNSNRYNVYYLKNSEWKPYSGNGSINNNGDFVIAKGLGGGKTDDNNLSFEYLDNSGGNKEYINIPKNVTIVKANDTPFAPDKNGILTHLIGNTDTNKARITVTESAVEIPMKGSDGNQYMVESRFLQYRGLKGTATIMPNGEVDISQNQFMRRNMLPGMKSFSHEGITEYRIPQENMKQPQGSFSSYRKL